MTPLVEYTIGDLLNQYSLLGLGFTVLVLGSCVARWTFKND
ncbi:hypothetical protein [Shouchella clausii]|nr:hypothetical protein [Shouchella clausii]